jgi:hypothetical protein
MITGNSNANSAENYTKVYKDSVLSKVTWI